MPAGIACLATANWYSFCLLASTAAPDLVTAHLYSMCLVSHDTGPNCGPKDYNSCVQLLHFRGEMAVHWCPYLGVKAGIVIWQLRCCDASCCSALVSAKGV